MSEKFNSGIGAVICDECGKMLLEGHRPGGGFQRVLHRVEVAVKNPAASGFQSQIDFCSAKCAHAHCQGPDVSDIVRSLICRALASHYVGGVSYASVVP